MTEFIDFETKNDLIAALHRGVVHISFKKADGSERLLNGTLLESLVIPYERKTERKAPVKNDSVQAVFDVDLQEWRSFRWDSIIRFYIDAEFFEN